MGESPSALLERAAAHLEKLAEHFEGYERAAREEPQRVGSPVTWWAYDTRDRNATQAAQRWLEAMNPSVAAPLVNWLRDTAEDLKLGPAQTSQEDYALEFARLVLGETETP